ncbi:unknown [Clostridium sp. CAG:505]|nr:unknown [Clostridium sp. CAG:505]
MVGNDVQQVFHGADFKGQLFQPFFCGVDKVLRGVLVLYDGSHHIGDDVAVFDRIIFGTQLNEGQFQLIRQIDDFFINFRYNGAYIKQYQCDGTGVRQFFQGLTLLFHIVFDGIESGNNQFVWCEYIKVGKGKKLHDGNGGYDFIQSVFACHNISKTERGQVQTISNGDTHKKYSLHKNLLLLYYVTARGTTFFVHVHKEYMSFFLFCTKSNEEEHVNI